jgi:hypothetical protein
VLNFCGQLIVGKRFVAISLKMFRIVAGLPRVAERTLGKFAQHIDIGDRNRMKHWHRSLYFAQKYALIRMISGFTMLLPS